MFHVPHPHLPMHLHLPRPSTWSWSEQELVGWLVTLLVLAVLLLPA